MSRIIKGDLTANFSIVKRTGFNDERLSWKAKGILAYLLTRPDDWQTYLKQLEKASKDGRESTAKGVKELQDLGYMKKRARKNDEGKFEGWDWFVYGEPDNVETEIRVSRNSEKPKDGEAVIDTKKEVTKKEVTKNNSYGDEYENQIWIPYGRVGNKMQGYRACKKLSKADTAALVASIPKYLKHLRETNSMAYQRHLATYVNNRCWETDWEAETRRKQPKQASATTLSVNIRNLKSY